MIMPPEFDNIKVKIKIPQMYILKSHKHNILFNIYGPPIFD